MDATEHTLPCGCFIDGRKGVLSLAMCAMHAAAPRMLALIQRMAQWERVGYKPLVLGTRLEINHCSNEARAILAHPAGSGR